MSFLYPLALTGIAAVGLPILLHMIRRHTRQRVAFSTLMFLRTTAPRLRNRRRLEHLPLLILRCLILCLLALAFARPFIPRAVSKRPERVGKRLAILIDTSASMRREGMWDQAVNAARTALEDAGPDDRVSIMSFDQDAQTLLGFEQWAEIPPERRASVADQQMSELSPSWARTELGRALVTTAETMEDDEINEEGRAGGQREILLISDLQQGSGVEALQAYEWPEGMKLTVKLIRPRGTTNAALQLMADRNRLASSDRDTLPRVRITNSADATAERFQLGWADESSTVDVYVAPGRSVVVRVPTRTQPSAGQRLVLTGDDHDFDNTLYVAPSTPGPVNVLYVGNDDPNDPTDMLFYLRQAFDIDDVLNARVLRRVPDETVGREDIEMAHLVVVADGVIGQSVAPLRQYLESGRTVMLVLRSPEAVRVLSDLAGTENVDSQEADVDQYAMLAQIEFDHPLLVSFADPRFGDFTRIHFWKYRRVDLANCPEAQILAHFDSGDPAWFEIPVGRGSLLVWTCGWHPADSDLALSSKFAPLLYSALEYGGTLALRQAQYAVGDPVPLPIRTMSSRGNRRMRKPDGSVINLEADQQTFAQTNLPGIYTSESSANTRRFAINLPPKESRTDPMPIEDLERLGVSMAPSNIAIERTEQATAQSSFSEMESEQKLWRWVIVAALAALLVETWLGGWLTPTDPAPEGEQI
ncbi:MAG: BatA and WFA domain-containing protein [Phycisphaerales bacterium]|nr:MAG: BatA and WFA domain-containing protein [Phycisphaerales bacterium]